MSQIDKAAVYAMLFRCNDAPKQAWKRQKQNKKKTPVLKVFGIAKLYILNQGYCKTLRNCHVIFLLNAVISN